MVEYTSQLDSIFSSLSDSTRRDILRRVAKKELSVNEISEPYDMTIAAVSKHLQVLEKAKLIMKRRQGKQQYVSLSPTALKNIDRHLRYYQKFWESDLDPLKRYLKCKNREQCLHIFRAAPSAR